ncbi:hypothetical protein BASA83_007215 [Batrachochytrium salamandrivorans]|nr:hypothetical protein BASA83_007215 [Batrachochytrium salamandrivorans]
MSMAGISLDDPDKLTSHIYPYICGTDQITKDFPQSLLLEFADVFSKTNANCLPAHSEYDFGIDLEPGFKPPHGKVYSLTPKETLAMSSYVQEQLSKNLSARRYHQQLPHVSSWPKRMASFARSKTIAH